MNNKLRKLIFTAIMASLAFILSTFVYFPSMAPFQHFINVICAVTLGPFYAFLEALMAGIMRMGSGKTIQAITGAIFGPIIGGLLYKKTGKIYMAAVGEVIGTGFIGALFSYPLMRIFYGLKEVKFYYYIPFYLPSAIMGAFMGYLVLMAMSKNNTLKEIQGKLK